MKLKQYISLTFIILLIVIFSFLFSENKAQNNIILSSKTIYPAINQNSISKDKNSAMFQETGIISYTIETTVASTDTTSAAEAVVVIDEEAMLLARLVYREARGVESVTEQACVIWTVFNRLDKKGIYGSSIEEIITLPHQYAYSYTAPIIDDYGRDLYQLALSVKRYWLEEQEKGFTSGRVLPRRYVYFYGDGERNWFYSDWPPKNDRWDFSWVSPYDT